MTTIDSLLRRALETSGPDLLLTLDPAFQGLPDTAHGGSVLAVFDALAGPSWPREVAGVYRRRVPLGTPLTFARARTNRLAIAAAVFVTSLSSAAMGAELKLSGNQEVPAVTTSAAGSGTKSAPAQPKW